MNPTRADLSISRIVDRADGPSDWHELDAAARQTPPWQDLLDALRLDATLRAAVAPARAAAESCALPALPALRAMPAQRRVLPWLGWAAALLVAAAWAITGHARAPEPESARAVARPEPASATDVVGELSRVVMDTRPTADGRAVEVLYLRRVLERTVVREAFQLAQDELGRPVPMQVDLARFSPPTSY